MSWSALSDSHVYDALEQETHFSGLDGDSKRVETFRKIDVWELLPCRLAVFGSLEAGTRLLT